MKSLLAQTTTSGSEPCVKRGPQFCSKWCHLEVQEELHQAAEDSFVGYYYFSIHMVESPLPKKFKTCCN